MKHTKRFLSLGIVLLLMFSLLAVPASANSAQTQWQGVDSVGTIVRDDDSPIIVEKELLTFDIQEFPDNYYSDLDSYLAYSGKVTAEYTFFNPADYGKKHTVSIASVRAGNVIGGGDWAKDRIIPDCIRALEAGRVIDIRSPKAVRPWEHVLEPLSGYMLLAQLMWNNPTEYCEGWNFGPEAEGVSTVWEVASEVIKNYGSGELKDSSDSNAVHEANLLMLNINKAKSRLGWYPRMNMQQCMELVVDWYKRYRTEDVYGLCVEEINKFIEM